MTSIKKVIMVEVGITTEDAKEKEDMDTESITAIMNFIANTTGTEARTVVMEQKKESIVDTEKKKITGTMSKERNIVVSMVVMNKSTGLI